MSQNNSSLTQAINDMRNMRESYDQLGAAAEAYNTGKTELAQNITAKGVEASATETLPELANKVAAISQETYEIDGGEMYAKQLFGSLETPNYWNLYEVLANLLSDGRLVSYGGILLAEYYRGYDSLALAGAGAGGAYVVSDMENGQFKMYTADTTHTWATEFDGKGNRWVAYCFADEYHDFQITDTNTSPRSIFIGRKVGTITKLVDTRIGEIMLGEGGRLRAITGYTADKWNKHTILRTENLPNVAINGNANVETLYVESGDIDISSLSNVYIFRGLSALTAIVAKLKSYKSNTATYLVGGGNSLKTIIIDCEDITYGTVRDVAHGASIYYLNLEEMTMGTSNSAENPGGGAFSLVYFGYKNNDKTKSVTFYPWGGANDVEIQDGWCKPLDIKNCVSLTKENVQAHIFDRLGVNDLSTGAVTITLANAVLNLFTQEEIDAVVARTNITIVGA